MDAACGGSFYATLMPLRHAERHGCRQSRAMLRILLMLLIAAAYTRRRCSYAPLLPSAHAVTACRCWFNDVDAA